ncbi:hypothetical protein [Streptomyces sp. RLB3-6]|uniref:hypothetical protein n=1 Tax=Streptomyces sp. RLB3-6 TaxID=2594457 RepID=UPI001162A1B3|nr:hypothetical protein [Streptomyces sp. RLB3-6]QDN84361.1 hypothetical protein FNV61_00085 [Streptomyces sp. RLB3-6]
MLNRQYHKRVLRAAFSLVGPGGVNPAAPADLVALVFGRHNYELDGDEAASYLDAARVARGARLPGGNASPAQPPVKDIAVTVYTPADVSRILRQGGHLS